MTDECLGVSLRAGLLLPASGDPERPIQAVKTTLTLHSEHLNDAAFQEIARVEHLYDASCFNRAAAVRCDTRFREG